MSKNLLMASMMLTTTVNLSGQSVSDLSEYRHRKQIPTAIEKNVLTALSFYPELKNTPIQFHFKKNIRSSVMQAQPVFTSLLRHRKKRCYRVNMAERFRLIHSHLSLQQIPDSVMIGWIGHELGHILDYEGRSNRGMVTFGCRYYLQNAFVKRAELQADSLAVERGMGRYIVATKRFILDHADLPQAYKDKIIRLYPSPDAILEQIQELEEKKGQQQ